MVCVYEDEYEMDDSKRIKMWKANATVDHYSRTGNINMMSTLMKLYTVTHIKDTVTQGQLLFYFNLIIYVHVYFIRNVSHRPT